MNTETKLCPQCKDRPARKGSYCKPCQSAYNRMHKNRLNATMSYLRSLASYPKTKK